MNLHWDGLLLLQGANNLSLRLCTNFLETTAPIIFCGDTWQIRVSDLSKDTGSHYCAFCDIPQNSQRIHFTSHHITFGIHCHLNCETAPLFELSKVASTLTYFPATIMELYCRKLALKTTFRKDEGSPMYFADEYNYYIFLPFHKIKEQNIYCFKLSVEILITIVILFMFVHICT